jgi:hypothetical protein
VWAQGLISAAKAVAGTTEDLVNSANDAAQRKAGEEVLVAAARGDRERDIVLSIYYPSIIVLPL